MLGNWSFGDYYKKEAISWAWELLTKVWGLEKNRLYATVFETDDEASRSGRKSRTSILHMSSGSGKRTISGRWGIPAPCGPCSEIHIDLTPDLRREGAGECRAIPRVMEIWNLVFIQNNRTQRTESSRISPPGTWTRGWGLSASAPSCRGKIQLRYRCVHADHRGGRRTDRKALRRTRRTSVAMRVIADHVRMLSFAIADGAIPGNEGRGYVLRRILRRAARFGTESGDAGAVHLRASCPRVAESMGNVFPKSWTQQDHIERVITSRRGKLHDTLDRGLDIFESVVERSDSRRVSRARTPSSSTTRWLPSRPDTAHGVASGVLGRYGEFTH